MESCRCRSLLATGKEMTEKDLEGMTIAELAPQIRSKKLSPVELTELCLKRIGRLNPAINAIVAKLDDDAYRSRDEDGGFFSRLKSALR